MAKKKTYVVQKGWTDGDGHYSYEIDMEYSNYKTAFEVLKDLEITKNEYAMLILEEDEELTILEVKYASDRKK